MEATLEMRPVAYWGISELCFWTARQAEAWSAASEHEERELVMFGGAYEARRERSHGVVSFTSGREAARPTVSERERDGRTWTIEKFRN